MNLGVRESVALARGILRSMRGKEVTPEVILCPAFTSLGEVHKAVSKSRISLGAQNCGTDRAGAFTGEISIPMLKDVGVSHVIIGHSERRIYLNEDDVIIRKKFRFAVEEKIIPILCVGESKEERDAGRALEYVKGQLVEVLKGVDIPKKAQFMIAYEPIWAIGSKNPASVADIIEMHQMIRKVTAKLTDVEEEKVVVLYGGSVNDLNAYDYLRESEIDGILVGGASIKLNQISQIISSAGEVLTAQS